MKERALGIEVSKQLNPGQQVVKIVNEELTALMGGQSAGLTFSPRPPTVILMAGLQGSGKTTATAKLAKMLREQNNSSVAVAACDVYRPAAVEQLVKVGTQAGATVYEQGTDQRPRGHRGLGAGPGQARRQGRPDRRHLRAPARRRGADGGAGAASRSGSSRMSVLLVVDAMTGQDAVNVAEQFAEVAQFDGVILSKLDGDARGGAALSVKAVTGKPIMFASTGEKLGDFERFHPDRMAQRILGMGDVLSFIEKAEQQVEEDEAKELERKLRKNQFTLEDFLDQLKRIRKMGPLTSILGMIPGLAGHQLSKMKVDDRELDRVEAIILSMTPYERRHPELIKGSRRLRIAKGERHERPAGQPARQAVRPDAQDDARAAAGQDARSRPAHETLIPPTHPPTPTRSAILPRRYGSQHATHPRRREEGSRCGASSSPTAALPATGASSRRSGATTPQTDPSTIVLNEERIRHWLDRGAQPSDRSRSSSRRRASRARSPVRELLDYLAQQLVDQPEQVRGRGVRGGRRHARARAVGRRR